MSTFQGHYIPSDAKLAGTCALLKMFELENLLLEKLHAISNHTLKNNFQQDGHWSLHSSSYWPGEKAFDHLVFSLKYETLNLRVLKKIYEKIDPQLLEQEIQNSPSGIYSRKIWFFYEWLTDKTLSIPDLKSSVKYVDLLDEKKYFAISGEKSSRHKISNNLTGVKNFCFIISRTDKLNALIKDDLKSKILHIVQSTDKRLISRAASFLLLADTKATYEIEGERPPQNRLERWGKVVLEAGKNSLTLEEIDRLHGILLKDSRFTKFGLRDTEVFLGDRDLDHNPRPEFIGARFKDVHELIDLWLSLNEKIRSSNLDPILQAVIVAFSFVYIHPLQDGNGRLHRYLLHHILADREFAPKGIIFPVSSVIFDRIDDYKKTLLSVSSPMMDQIEWESDEKLNVKILNETKFLYQYFNLTSNAEFFYEIVKETIESSLPQELLQLKSYDQAKDKISNYIEMPEKDISLLITSIRDNGFKLSENKRKKFFGGLTDQEVIDIENRIQEAYEKI